MKKLVYFFLIFFMFVGCETKIKVISTVKCKSCGKILEGPDTTIVRGTYNRDTGILTTSEGRMYHLKYYGLEKGKVIKRVDEMICEECKKEQKLASIKNEKEYRRQLTEFKKRKAKKKREKKKQELADRFVESGIRFGIISDMYRQMNYDLKYRTLSSQIQFKANEIDRYTDDVFMPAADEFGYYLNKYIEKYGIKKARDLAIKNGFLHVFKYSKE